MIRGVPAALLAVAFVVSTLAPGHSESVFPRGSPTRPRFVANLAALPAGGDSVVVEVSWKIPFPELSFGLEDDWYRARYDVTVVFSQDGRQIAGEVWERRARTRDRGDTISSGQVSNGRRRVPLPAGAYDVRITVTDRRSRESSQVRGRLDAFSKGTRIGLSHPQLVRYTGGTPLPNPGNEVPIGEDGHRVRIAIHPDESVQGPCEVSWSLDDAAGERITAADTSIVLEGESRTVEFEIPSERLSAGEHRLTVRVKGPGDSGTESRTSSLVGRLTSRWFHLRRKEALEVFRIIATKDEIRVLENADDRSWPGRVEGFWRLHDPEPSTAENEYRATIQIRMETAATLFQEPFLRPGWRTDRGRIWLEFGPPDRRSSAGGGFQGPERELWEYDSPSRAFLFVDERGTGEFWLRG